MKLFILITAWAFSGSLFAFPGLENLQPAKAKTGFSDDAPQCADLSGNWKGTCTYQNGKTKEESVKLVASCERVLFPDVPQFNVSIGGRVSTSSVQAGEIAYLNDFSFGANWNTERTVLTLDLNGLDRSLSPTAPTTIYTMNAKLSRDGDKLVASFTGTEVGTCVYSKQP